MKDIESVERLMKSKTQVHPIILINNSKRVVLLDGVHRLVAAKLTNTPLVAALIIKI